MGLPARIRGTGSGLGWDVWAESNGLEKMEP